MDINLRLAGNRKYIYIVLSLVLILSGYFAWKYMHGIPAGKPDPAISSQETISAAKEENSVYKATVKTAAEKAKRDSEVIHEVNKKYVLVLSPDAVASDVVSELELFRYEQKSSSDIRETQPEEEIVFSYVPEGWQTPEPGYWTNESSGRLILEGLRTWRMDRDHWKSAYIAQNEASVEYAESTSDKLRTLEEQFESNKQEIVKSKYPGFGVFAGPAYTSGGNFQFAVGVGVVWKFWP